MQMNRRHALLGGAALAAAPRLAQAQSRAETLRQVTGNTINTLDPTMLGSTRESFGLSMAVYDRLLAFGRKPVPGGFTFDHSSFRGELAEAWEVSPDGLRITLHMRQGATWHDGTPVTAADAKWSLDRAVAAPSLAPGAMATGSLTRVEQFRVAGPMTVEVLLEKPDRLALSELCIPYCIMVNSALAKRHATAEDPWAMRWMKENTAASGAYTVETFRPGEQVVLRRNESWKGGLDGKPAAFRRVIAQTVPEAATRATLLERGDADISIDLQASDVPALIQRGRVKLFTVPESNGFTHISFNTQLAPFDNPKLRRAIAAALPYADMFQAAMFGRGAPLFGGTWSEEPPTIAFPQPMPLATDLGRARALLAEAGFPNGLSTTFAFSVGQAQRAEPMAALLQESLGRIGIRVDLQKMPDAQFNSLEAEKRLPFYTDGGVAWLPTTDYYFRLYFTGNQRWNFSSFDNAEMNALVAQAQFELNSAEYERICKRMIGILGAEVPQVMMWQPNHEAVMAHSLEGYAYHPWRQIDFRDLRRA